MLPFALSPDEKARLKCLEGYEILDSDFEEAYDDLVEIASLICDTPIALISLIDEKRQWFKAVVGLETRETPRDIAFCSHAIHNPEELLVVTDATQDERFADNPLVTSDPKIRFYAGAPLNTPSGYCLGTLCVIDRHPRQLSPHQAKALRVLADQVVNQLELRQSLKKIEINNQTLAKLNRNKDKFFATLAHDLRSPFNGIIGLSEIIKNDASLLSQEQIKEYATDIHDSAEEALKLLNSLLEWSIFETGGVLYQPSYFSITETAQRVATLLGSIAEKKRIRLSLELAGNIQVYADSRMIYSVLQNLVANALKFTPSGGSVKIKGYTQDFCVYLSVSDTGMGMTPERLEYLFGDSLSQSTAYSTKGTAGESGAGLGLVLCRRFMESNSGKLIASSQLGVGSEFTMVLPVYP
jgi:signal transduction histidine kinase